VAIGLGLLLVVAVLGAGVWYQFFREQPSAVRRAATPVRPSPVSTTTMPTTLPTTLPSTAEPTPAPEASIAPAAPTTTLPRGAAPIPTATAPPAREPSGSLADARSAFQRGEFSRAARDFAASLRKSSQGSYSVQLLVACSEETLQKAVQSVAAHELFILPVDYKGRSCYRVCWGIYDSEALARSATREVPDYFRKGGASPKPVATTAILP
jgi:septal ring-binding cell division protein DamX